MKYYCVVCASEFEATGPKPRCPGCARSSTEAETARVEADPNGKDQNAPGAKLDAGKPRMELVLLGFSDALTMVAEVGTFGANKYTDNGWKEVPDGANRYTGALLRHLFAETREETDPDSELAHAAHAAWNALARLQLMVSDNERQ